jgi:hypothetical protein
MVIDKFYDFGEILSKHLINSRLNGLEIGFQQLTRLSATMLRATACLSMALFSSANDSEGARIAFRIRSVGIGILFFERSERYTELMMDIVFHLRCICENRLVDVHYTPLQCHPAFGIHIQIAGFTHGILIHDRNGYTRNFDSSPRWSRCC